MTQNTYIGSIEKEEKMISNLIKSMSKYNRFVMLCDLLTEFKKVLTLKKTLISKSSKNLLSKILKNQSNLFQNSKKIQIKCKEIMKRKDGIKELMKSLDHTMINYHKSYSGYERIFISEKILEDIATYHKCSKDKAVKEQIKKIRYNVFLKRKLYEKSLREYNSQGKKYLDQNVILCLIIFLKGDMMKKIFFDVSEINKTLKENFEDFLKSEYVEILSRENEWNECYKVRKRFV